MTDSYMTDFKNLHGNCDQCILDNSDVKIQSQSNLQVQNDGHSRDESEEITFTKDSSIDLTETVNRMVMNNITDPDRDRIASTSILQMKGSGYELTGHVDDLPLEGTNSEAVVCNDQLELETRICADSAVENDIEIGDSSDCSLLPVDLNKQVVADTSQIMEPNEIVSANIVIQHELSLCGVSTDSKITKDLPEFITSNELLPSNAIIKQEEFPEVADIRSALVEYSSDSCSTFSLDSSVSLTSTNESESEYISKTSRFEPLTKAYDSGPKTTGELALEDIPIGEQIKLKLDDGVVVEQIGVVSAVIDEIVVVQSLGDTAPVDADTWVFNESRESVAQIFETFGPVKRPLYSLRFSSRDTIDQAALKVGSKIFFAPTITDYTAYVFVKDLISLKGSDASWLHNHEPPPGEIAYSDDEKERVVKKGKRVKRSRQRASPQDSKSGTTVTAGGTCWPPKSPSGTPFLCQPPPDPTGGSMNTAISDVNGFTSGPPLNRPSNNTHFMSKHNISGPSVPHSLPQSNLPHNNVRNQFHPGDRNDGRRYNGQTQPTNPNQPANSPFPGLAQLGTPDWFKYPPPSVEPPFSQSSFVPDNMNIPGYQQQQELRGCPPAMFQQVAPRPHQNVAPPHPCQNGVPLFPPFQNGVPPHPSFQNGVPPHPFQNGAPPHPSFQNGVPPFLPFQNGVPPHPFQNGAPPHPFQNGAPPHPSFQNGVPPVPPFQNGIPPPFPNGVPPNQCPIPTSPVAANCDYPVTYGPRYHFPAGYDPRPTYTDSSGPRYN